MAEEIDRKIMPEFLQMAFAVSLGITYKSFEMLLDPLNSAETLYKEAQSLLVIPKEEGLQKKAEAIAATWMAKGAGAFEACKAAGEKFTEAK